MFNLCVPHTLGKRARNSAIILLILLNYCSIASAGSVIAPITEKEWTVIFLKFIDNESPRLIEEIRGDATKTLDSAVKQIIKSNNENDINGIRSGVREGLIGHLLSWYASELSLFKDTSAWAQNRIALLDNRRTFIRIGLDSYALEESFHNMNRAARSLALPTIHSLN